MMNKKSNFLVYICDQLIKWGLPVLLFLIAISFYLKTYDSCQIKITLLLAGAPIIIGVWLVKIIAQGGLPRTEYSHRIGVPIFVFLVICIISFLLDPLRAWGGCEELPRRLCYIGLLFVAMFEFRDIRKLKVFLYWCFLAVLLTGSYGVIQFLETCDRFSFGSLAWLRNAVCGLLGVEHIDPFVWRGAFSDRIFSTFGNPNFHASWFVLVAPLVLAQYFNTKKKIWLALFALVVFNVFSAQAKGGYVGLTAAMVLFVFLFWRYILTGAKKKKLGLVLAGGALGMLLFSGYGINYFVQKRIDTVHFRLFTWLSTYEMIREDPGNNPLLTTARKPTPLREVAHQLFGAGTGTFKVLYPAFRRPEIFHIEGKHNTETDHAHNEYLEIWFEHGIIGLGIYFWLLLTGWMLGTKKLKQLTTVGEKNPSLERKWYLLGLICGLFGMLAQGGLSVHFRFVSSGSIFWTAWGLAGAQIIALPQKTEEKVSSRPNLFFQILLWCVFISIFFWMVTRNDISTESKFARYFIFLWALWGLAQAWATGLFSGREQEYVLRRKTLQHPIWPLVQVGIVLVVIGISVQYYRQFKANIYHNIAIAYSKGGRWEPALENYKKVIKNHYSFVMAHYFMGNVFNDRWDLRKQYNPKWGDKNNIPRTDAERALAKYADVKKLAPNYVQVHFQEGNVYLKLGQWDKAIEDFKKALALDPVFPQTYFKMAWCYVQKKQWPEAEQSYQKAVEWHPNFVPAYINLGNVYYLEKKYAEAEQTFKKALALDPNNLDANRSLANLYFVAKMYPQSIKYGQKVLELNPEDERAKEILSRFKK